MDDERVRKMWGLTERMGRWKHEWMDRFTEGRMHT